VPLRREPPTSSATSTAAIDPVAQSDAQFSAFAAGRRVSHRNKHAWASDEVRPLLMRGLLAVRL
jgi:hypothetical protein